MLAAKIKQGWGYTVGAEPPNVLLQQVSLFAGGQKTIVTSIAHWPDANPPSIAEIQAIVLPLDRAQKQSALDAAWNNHPGVEITLADQSTIHVPIQFELVSFNASIVSLALLMQSDAILADRMRNPITIPAAQLVTVFAQFQAGYQALLTQYNTIKAAIESAATEEELNAIEITL
jgi:hypothetical protein